MIFCLRKIKKVLDFVSDSDIMYTTVQRFDYQSRRVSLYYYKEQQKRQAYFGFPLNKKYSFVNTGGTTHMKITKIVASEVLTLYTDSNIGGKVYIKYFSPALAEKNVLCENVSEVKDGVIVCDRFEGGRDLMYCKISVTDENGKPVEGKEYVEEILDSERSFDYPVADTKKGLQVTMVKDAVELGVRHAALNVNLGDFLMPAPDGDNTIEFIFDGKIYYINKKITEKNDAKVKELSDNGIIITFILLNSKHWTTTVSDEFWNIIKHPGYTPDGLISQFNVMEEQGLDYYRAFVAFISDRYTQEDERYGRAVGLIVGNEINSGYVWCNAGEMSCEQYCYEYTTALRIAYQTSRVFYDKMRIYISLDHFWTGANENAAPNRYYGSKFVLDYINRYCLSEGQIPWNIAHHPYPEDLRYPDFWNDVSALPNLDAPIITFKNLEVLAEFLYQKEYLYNGERRRIILSEQGFNSFFTPESEIVQAMAYGRAYKKIMQIPEIDSFILHAHQDNKEEFGLNLGLWRRKPDSGELDAPKPVYYVFKMIDRKDEKGVWHWERY